MASVATAYGTGFYPNNFANNKLKWEQTKAWNVGLDLNFLNRIEFIFDAYLKNTDNLLMPAALPTYVSGVIGAPWVNSGAMRNKGFEFTLNTVNISNKNFEWTSGLTFSLNRNEVTKLYTESSGIQGNINGLTYTYTTVGQPVAQFYGYEVIGMFEKEDDFYQKDINGDYLLDAKGNKMIVALPEDKVVDEPYFPRQSGAEVHLRSEQQLALEGFRREPVYHWLGGQQGIQLSGSATVRPHESLGNTEVGLRLCQVRLDRPQW